MKRIPNAKQIIRFALAVTPAIWITLFAIEQSPEPTPMYTYKLASIPAFTTDCYGCRDEPQTSLIDTLLPVAGGFQSKALQSTVSSADKSDSPDYSRYVVYMFLPCGLSQGEIDAHLRDAARSHFEGGAMTVHVIACCTARPEASLPLPVYLCPAW